MRAPREVDERQIARQSLRHLAAEGTDTALLQQMAATAGQERLELIRAAADRRTPGAAAPLLDLTDSPDSATRLAAFEALEVLGDGSTVPQLVARLLSAQDPQERAAAQRAAWQCSLRQSDSQLRIAPLLAAYERGSAADRQVLLPLLGRIGGNQALQLIRAARTESDEPLRAAAVQALANWPDATAAEELLELARNGEQPSYRIQALRGYIRVVTLPGVRTPDETFAMLEPALALAERPDEKRLILERLPAVVTPRSLQAAIACLDQPELAAAAAASAAQLAESLLPTASELARQAMARILKVTPDPILRARLERAVAKPQ